jgi:hypothetical protein
MRKKLLCFMVLAAAAIVVQNASAVVMDFEDLPLNHTYYVGDSFVTSTVTVHVQQYTPVITPLNMVGHCIVDDLQYAGGTGKELGISGVSLTFLLNFDGHNAHGIALLFSELTDSVVLGINGDVRSATNLLGFDKQTIGGTYVSVRGYPVGAILIASGSIDSFTIGGQSLFIDKFLTDDQPVPEPATIILLGLGGMSVLMGRKK